MNEDFDPEWIIELARAQVSDRTDIIETLEQCRKGTWESRAYIHFVSQKNANQPNSEWQFEENIVLEHPKKGTIVLDVLKDKKIGGIEFVSLIN